MTGDSEDKRTKGGRVADFLSKWWISATSTIAAMGVLAGLGAFIQVRDGMRDLQSAIPTLQTSAGAQASHLKLESKIERNADHIRQTQLELRRQSDRIQDLDRLVRGERRADSE